MRQPNIVPHNWQSTDFSWKLTTSSEQDLKSSHSTPSTSNWDHVIPETCIPLTLRTSISVYLDDGGRLFVGFVLCLTYRKAVEGSKVAIIMYAFFFSGLILMPFNEQFFMQLNHIIKLFAVAWIVYCLPLRLQQFSNVLRHTRASESSPPLRENTKIGLELL